MKHSIIVPVYNMEKYLERCLRSLQNQKTEFVYEVIVINDGSTDGSDRICRSFSDSDKRFRYVCQPNGGVSSARNTGLSEACGEYISFVDSDDYVDSDYCEILCNAADQMQADILVFGHKTNYPDGTQIISNAINTNAVSITRDTLLHFFCRYCLHFQPANYIGNKLFRRKLIQNHGAKFPVDIHFAEDRAFNYSLYPHANTVGYINAAPYHYYRHPDAVCLSAALKTNIISSYLKVYTAISELWEKENITAIDPVKPVVLLRMLQGAFFHTMQTVQDLHTLKEHFAEAVSSFPLKTELPFSEDTKSAIDTYARLCGLNWYEKSKLWLFALSVFDGGDAIVEWQKIYPIYSNVGKTILE